MLYFNYTWLSLHFSIYALAALFVMNFECKSISSPRTYMQIHTPTVSIRGFKIMELLPRVFDMLQCFETTFPIEESL